jgi:hypothetical protein
VRRCRRSDRAPIRHICLVEVMPVAVSADVSGLSAPARPVTPKVHPQKVNTFCLILGLDSRRAAPTARCDPIELSESSNRRETKNSIP